MSTHTGHPDLAAALAYLDVMERAIVLARAALRGEGSPTLFVTSEPVLANGKHGRFDAESAAEVAEGVGPSLAAPHPFDWTAEVRATHAARLRATTPPGGGAEGVEQEDVRRFIGALCPVKWGDPGDPMRCSLTSGHEGNHATTERIEWGGAWQTAEAAAGGWTSGTCSTGGLSPASWSDPDGAAS